MLKRLDLTDRHFLICISPSQQALNLTIKLINIVAMPSLLNHSPPIQLLIDPSHSLMSVQLSAMCLRIEILEGLCFINETTVDKINLRSCNLKALLTCGEVEFYHEKIQ
jgi:hypothetical protein